tara:strand:- start:2030 stop:2260 length:231 start_codon:yes stop_codon:yes gene_type:complete
MYVKAMISECDMTNTKYDREVEGAHVISRSAVGRHTCVLYAGPEYLADKGIIPLEYDVAIAEASSYIDVNGGYIDF